ncbi:hypothetical protein [Nocardia goodfellowii]|uniref:Membrane protein n=1 Tax=Nocardia goodfellowii TaxID=882446 RepID=A0ABS4QR98_9NOCA|nr:hypothetical protein [Nocardia goodfellowii]MBP2194215.1 putative membrane protein [Nocardia goodfellowii]
MPVTQEVPIDDSPSQHTATAPGLAVSIGALAGVLILLCVRLDRAPWGGHLTNPDQLVWLLIGVPVLGVSLLTWAIKTLYVVGRERRWSWKIAGAPLIVLAGLVAGLLQA